MEADVSIRRQMSFKGGKYLEGFSLRFRWSRYGTEPGARKTPREVKCHRTYPLVLWHGIEKPVHVEGLVVQRLAHECTVSVDRKLARLDRWARLYGVIRGENRRPALHGAGPLRLV